MNTAPLRSIACALGLAGTAGAQAPPQPPGDWVRAADRAYEQGDFQRAAQLLSYSLNPDFGLSDSVWSAVLQKLVHALIETGDAPIARVWLRWALRQKDTLRVDDAAFPPAVIATFAQEAALAAPASGADTGSRIPVRWRWPAQPASWRALGGLQIVLASDSLRAELEDAGGTQTLQTTLTLAHRLRLGTLSLGRVRYLPAGTYTVTVSVPWSWYSASVELEVLPGVVTELAVGSNLPARTTSLYLVCIPESLFLLDGEPVGYAPARPPSRSELQLTPGISWNYPLPWGRHSLSCRRDRYATWDTTLVVRSDEPIRLEIRLRKLKP